MSTTPRSAAPATVVSLASHLAHRIHPGPNPVFRDTDEAQRLAEGLGLDADVVVDSTMALLDSAGIVESSHLKVA